MATLRGWRRAELEERLVCGPAWSDTGYVFTKEDGHPIHPDRLSKVFDQLVGGTDVPRIRLHDLRHTSATIMLAQGVPLKVVSERLGHANIEVTADIYMHVTQQMDQAAADGLGDAIFG